MTGRNGSRRRTTILVLGVLLVVGALSGCAQLTDIHDRSLIFGLGIDQGPQRGMITLSAQALHPPEGGTGGGTATSGGGGGGKGGEWKTLVSSGSTVSQALGRLQAQSSRQVFLGQLGIAFLSASLARQGVLHQLDFLVRSPQVTENLPITVVEGRADAFLQGGTQQQVAWRVRAFVTRARANLAVLPNPLWHFMAQSFDLAGATYAPVFTAAPGAEGLRYVGTAVFLQGRMVDTLSPEESAALAWLIKREGFGGITLGNGGNEFDVALHGIRAKWNVRDPSAPRLSLSAIGEVTASPGRSLADRPSGMRQLVAHEMAAEIADVLQRLQGDKADLLGIGERLREQGSLPPGPWPTNFARLRFTVSVQVLLIPGKVR